MKRTIFLIAIVTMMASMVFGDNHLRIGSPEGDWSLVGDRLHQRSASAPRAKAWMMIPQRDSMVYEFTLRYEGGAEDGHGGVGIHILADSAPQGKSWGMSDSWLLWLNYDVSPTVRGVPRGLSAQVYKSYADKSMEIVQSISLRSIESIAAKYLNREVPVKLTYLADRGRILIADPRGTTAGWYVDLPGAGARGARGSYVAVRTNGVKASFRSRSVNL